MRPGDRVLLPGWGGNSIKVGEEVSRRICLYRVVLLTSSFTLARCNTTGVSPFKDLEDPCENLGVGG